MIGYRMTRLLKWILALALLLGLGTAWIYADYRHFVGTPLALASEERIIQVPDGATASAVVDLLYDAHIIDSKWKMMLVLRTSGFAHKIQPGTVILTPDMTPADLPQLLAKVGKYARLSVQILNGMNLYEIAARLKSQRIADEVVFIELATNPAVAAESGIPAKSFEGYLAAGAYTFEPGVSTRDVLGEMHERWRKQWQKVIDENRGAYEQRRRYLSDHALVTLASIVEKEAILDRERPIIARVFYNRLQKMMKLQSDPTCVYPPLYKGEKPTPARCKDAQNPYSTYMIPALPPGPIAIPSVASLLAVIRPYTGPDGGQILYFVARNDGSRAHYFSKTYAEHQVAVDYFLKGKKKKPQGTVQPK